MIAILNYGSGNIQAIANVYESLRIPYAVTKDVDTIKLANKIILPGVGAFTRCIELLTQTGIREILDERVIRDKVPILGICVGMQMMACESEESNSKKGFSWIEGNVKKFDKQNLTQKPYTPHMGWNTVSQTDYSPLFEGIDQSVGFYFLHSYFFECEFTENIAGQSIYGSMFTSAIHKENIYGVQFHPEKSHKNGIKLLENFAKI